MADLNGKKHTRNALNAPQSAFNPANPTEHTNGHQNAPMTQQSAVNGVPGNGPSPEKSHAEKVTKRTAALTRARVGRWQDRFIEVFRQTGIVRAAAEAAGVAREYAYRHRDKNPRFAIAWQKAIDESTELLELHAWRRATTGVGEDVWMNTKEGPKKVGTKTVYSDRLLEFMMRARKPQVYRENQTVEVTGAGGAPLAPVVIPQTVQFIIPSNGRNDPAHIIDLEKVAVPSSTEGKVQ